MGDSHCLLILPSELSWADLSWSLFPFEVNHSFPGFICDIILDCTRRPVSVMRGDWFLLYFLPVCLYVSISQKITC